MAVVPVTVKPGYKTTEMWVVVLTNVGAVVAASADWLAPRYAALAVAASTASYSIARGLAKVTPPKAVEPLAGPPPGP